MYLAMIVPYGMSAVSTTSSSSSVSGMTACGLPFTTLVDIPAAPFFQVWPDGLPEGVIRRLPPPCEQVVVPIEGSISEPLMELHVAREHADKHLMIPFITETSW